MIRYRFFINFRKEEAWLNEMARQGWGLAGVGMGYHFRADEPQNAQIRIDFRRFSDQEAFTDYVTMFEDSGWQHIAGSRTSGAQYFRRVAADSSEDIFSDSLSRAGRYQRYARLWFSISVVFLLLIVTLGATGAADLLALVQPGRFYLTPGLWDRSGDAFWRAFWFETPFALFRALLLYSFPFSLVMYLTFAWKSYRLYQEEKKYVTEA